MTRPKRNLSEARVIRKPVSPQARKGRKNSSVDTQPAAATASPAVGKAPEDAGTAAVEASQAPPCKLPRNDDREGDTDQEIAEVAVAQSSPTCPVSPPAPPQQSTTALQIPKATAPAVSPSTPPASGACPLLTLPNELLLMIGHLLPERTLSQLLPTCRRLHILLTHILYRLGRHIEFLDQRTLLHLAAERGFYLTTHHLLTAGASPNTVSSPRNIHPLHSDGLTPLHIASRLNRARILRLLLSYGAKTRVWDAEGNTPLHTAVENGNIPILRLLVRSHAKLTSRRSDGMRPLHVAAMMGDKRALKILLDAGANVDACDDTGGTALGLAAGVEEEGCVKMLLKHGASTEARDRAGWTPAFWAAWAGSVQILAVLVKEGAELDGRDKDGKGLLEVAKEREKMEVVRWLERREKKASKVVE